MSDKKTALNQAIDVLKSSKKIELDHFVPVGSQDYTHPSISTGNIKLDYLIGEVSFCPGVPRRGITNVYGPEHSGKTTFALQVCASAIKSGGCVCYIDFENILDTRYAKKLGIPVEDDSKFALYQPETLEQGVIALLTMVDNGVDVIVFDSLGAAIPKAALEMSMKDIEDGKTGGIGLSARKWSEYLPRIQQKLKDNNSALIAISQTRSGISQMFAASETVQGGKGWKFYSMLRLELVPIAKIYSNNVFDFVEGKSGKGFVGTNVRVTVKKCKVAPTQNRSVVVDCIPNRGFDPVRSVIDFGKSTGVISCVGSWFKINFEESKHAGYENLYKYLKENSEAYDRLYNEVINKINTLLASGKNLDGDTAQAQSEDESGIIIDGLDIDEFDDPEEDEIKEKTVKKKGKK